jgi:hypothetical protein
MTLLLVSSSPFMPSSPSDESQWDGLGTPFSYFGAEQILGSAFVGSA